MQEKNNIMKPCHTNSRHPCHIAPTLQVVPKEQQTSCNDTKTKIYIVENSEKQGIEKSLGTIHWIPVIVAFVAGYIIAK